jgi:enamine deaminase RidA (YjgF/YER057c/UK114 family)
MTARAADASLIAPGDVRAQTERIFAQLAEILDRAGGGLQDVVKLTVFLADMASAGEVQQVRNRIWPDQPPVSATVEVNLVAEGVMVEIEAVAAIAARVQRPS